MYSKGIIINYHLLNFYLFYRKDKQEEARSTTPALPVEQNSAAIPMPTSK